MGDNGNGQVYGVTVRNLLRLDFHDILRGVCHVAV